MNRWFLGVTGMVAAGIFAGACEPEEDTHEATIDSGTQTPDSGDRTIDSGPDVRDSCHIDCFGALFCEGAQIKRELFAPVPCSAPMASGQTVCRDRGSSEGLSCGDGVCSEWIADPRYKSCNPTSVYVPGIYPTAHMERLRCTTLPAEGSTCSSDADCHPMVDVVDGNLRCDVAQKRCVTAPRPPAAELKTCTAGSFGCIDLCGTFYQPRTCVVDEECPQGMDCARSPTDTTCRGVCLPRAYGRDPKKPICP